eukprot:TRINITY_DN8601_c0_g1_i2.p1 TRINITY_DN8601_c0_g1~~TRINITY_DN8601_c0_g1_i2.p1  ORF type:complete len:446 (+),score=109.11 TRINITY_DN8601_c0_g1_i2:201-1538(+)
MCECPRSWNLDDASPSPEPNQAAPNTPALHEEHAAFAAALQASEEADAKAQHQDAAFAAALQAESCDTGPPFYDEQDSAIAAAMQAEIDPDAAFAAALQASEEAQAGADAEAKHQDAAFAAALQAESCNPEPPFDDEQDSAMAAAMQAEIDPDAAFAAALQAEYTAPHTEDAALAAFLNAEAQEIQQRREADALASQDSLPMLAAEVCERLRAAARDIGLEHQGNIVNFDLCLEWLQRHSRHLDENQQSGSRRTTVLTVYHGTSAESVDAIVDNNLKVPDGHRVRHKTDTGFYGCGIYTSPTFSHSEGYDANNSPFVCLALPGRQSEAFYPADQGKSCHKGFDSHYSSGGGDELVFFHSDQLLPCFRLTSAHLAAAERVLPGIVEFIAERTGNERPFGSHVPEQRHTARAYRKGKEIVFKGNSISQVKKKKKKKQEKKRPTLAWK